MTVSTELKDYVLDLYHPDALDLIQNIPGIQAILPGDPRMGTWHSDADGLMVRSDSRLTERDFAKAQRLRVVVKQDVGVDNIDLNAAKKRSITVHNTPLSTGH
ncbi:hypothetical protein ETB97_003412 [Aspergillus alliaceus]|uniref:D-isomer specific 2-hydroxyacid dehydrogenase catalytic domain-containing protein n=1 Tax=Petromyces alliaceus TaxID=209559 RepID=A0A8H6AA10_PETAA|nr:hypothetical protein ETB97_003412 [Aspergillus burnettii]